MITAVDTSVILDLLVASPRYLESSRRLFHQCQVEGKIIVCPVVWGEIRPFFDNDRAMAEVIGTLGVSFDDFGRAVASHAGSLWKGYRKRRGPRERILADFLIGSHALLKAERLLTRDRGFYRDCFSELTLLDSSAP